MRLLFLSAGLSISLLLGQQAIPNAAPPQTLTGDPAVLEGKTLGVNGQSIKKATLTLRPSDVRPGEMARPYTTSSDAEGKFVFQALEPGRYQLWAERPGFIRQVYGGKAGQYQGTIINLTPGQHMKDVIIQLLPQAVVTGKVLDEDGDPVGRARVEVLKPGYSRGRRQMLPIAVEPTDEAGEFKISSLAPGRYYVCATAMNPTIMGAETTRSASNGDSKKPQEAFIPTCYPNCRWLHKPARDGAARW